MKLVATDIDGTIVAPGATVSSATRAAFDQCRARAIPVVLVTGRPMRWLPDIFAQLNFSGTAICSNGAVVISAPNGQVMQHTPISRPGLARLATVVLELWPQAWLAAETLTGLVCAQTAPASHEIPDNQAPTILAETADVIGVPDALKFLVRVEGMNPDDMVSTLQPLVADVAEVTHSNPADHLLEIAPKNVTKAATLATLCEHWQIDATDVIAFGDMPNDIEMLAWAGTGYAMSAGHPAAIAAADAIAPPCAQDGVADVINQHLAQLS